MKRLVTFPILLFLFFVSFTAFALSIYNAEVVLQGNDKKAKEEAKQEGFKQVLIRASGKKETLLLPEIQQSLSNVDQFLTQISYEYFDSQGLAKYGYDDKKILQLLKKAKASIWGEERPNVLVWLVNTTENQIIWDKDLSLITQDIRAAALRRALPVFIPFGDSQDIINITSADLINVFSDSIMQASIKYQPEGLVIAKITDNAIQWQFFPSLELLDDPASINQRVAALSARGVNSIIDDIAEYYADESGISMALGSAKPFLFKLHGIEKAQDFYLAEKILKKLNSVARLALKSVKDDELTFDLAVYGDASLFQTELAKYDQMQFISIAEVAKEKIAIDMQESEIKGNTDGALFVLDVDEELVSTDVKQHQNKTKTPLFAVENAEMDSQSAKATEVLIYKWHP